MNLKILNPNDHPDWDVKLGRSNDSCFFQTAAWARVLEASYGFKPKYFGMLETDRFALLMPFMEIRSFLTGKRGVSLPFTDHCPPVVSNIEDLPAAVQAAIDYGERNGWSYLEWRHSGYSAGIHPPSETYYFHEIDLTKTDAELFQQLNDNNRRNIRKAAREGLRVNIDSSLWSLREFYRLNLITRKRHGLPPQPFSFFRSVFDHVLSTGYGVIVTATHEEKVIAASVFFRFGTKALYKYGASELKYQSLRPNNFVLWEALRWLKDRGVETIDLGRTDPNNTGLLQFKRTWGARESLLNYYRYSMKEKAYVRRALQRTNPYTRLLANTPTSVLRIIGRLFYKHAG
jgi:hypothetical protein